MKKVIINSFKYTIFFAVGVFIFWLIYRKIQMKELKEALKGINYFWIAISVLFGVLANLSRAIRWKMLIKPLGYNPKLSNTFLSVLVMYFINLIVPRAGEVARCTVVSRTDKIPFTKLVGTVFVERLADFIMLVILVIAIFIMNFPYILRFFRIHPEVVEKSISILSIKNLLLVTLVITIALIALFFLKKRLKKSRRKRKLVELRNHFIEGIKSIAQLDNIWLFIAHTAFIFLMWLFMLYVVFLAYEPTAHLTLRVGIVTFLMGGLAMLAPIQGGIGPWHFMVYETLLLYGIPIEQGKIFALVAHTSTNLIYLVLGGSALIILMFIQGGLKKIELSPLLEKKEV
jgi:uncharacterized protein (TIRG00374 family)